MVATNIIEGRKRLQRLLRAVRLEARLTQAEVARRVGQRQSYVSKAEQGERRLDLPQLAELCDAIGIELDAFVRRYAEEGTGAGDGRAGDA